MSIPVQCQCGQRFAAPEQLAGKTGKCPRCGQPLTIPGAAAAEESGGIGDLLDEVGLGEVPTGHACPKCRTPLPEGAILCVSCGYHLEKGTSLQTKRVQERRPVRGFAEQAMVDAGREDYAESYKRLGRIRDLELGNERAMRGIRLMLSAVVLEVLCLLPLLAVYFKAASKNAPTIIPLPAQMQPGGAALWGMCLIGLIVLVGGMLSLVGIIYCLIGSGPSKSRMFLVACIGLYVLAMVFRGGTISTQPNPLAALMVTGCEIAWLLFIWKFSLHIGLKQTSLISLGLIGFFVLCQGMGALIYLSLPAGDGGVAAGMVVISPELALRNSVEVIAGVLPDCGHIWLLSRIVRGL